MSDENRNEEQDEELTALEADLAALRPRADGLDRGWRELLAKEAALTSVMLQHDLQGCINPAGHRFLCIHCGSERPTVGSVRRWSWPAVAAAMTSVAAVLLAVLVTRPEARVALGVAKESRPPVAAPAQGAVEEQDTATALETRRASEDWLAMKNVSRVPLAGGADNMPYVTLRDQVLAYGVESWKIPVAAVGTSNAMEVPLSYREQLNRLLEQQGLSGS